MFQALLAKQSFRESRSGDAFLNQLAAIVGRLERGRTLAKVQAAIKALPSESSTAQTKLNKALTDAIAKAAKAGPKVAQPKRVVTAPSRKPRRDDVVREYQSVLRMKGSAENGRQVFRQFCNVCHQADGLGNAIGPNIAAMKSRGPEAILVNVIDPNREINPEFHQYIVTMNDGRVLLGIKSSETANSIGITQLNGVVQTVLKADIKELRDTGMSLMPEGLEAGMQKQGMADVIAYIMSL